MNLISGDELQSILINGFKTANKVTIISAYFTQPAAKLLLQYLPLTSSAKVVVRARPVDLLSGATDIKAIRLMYENGIPCHIHRSLHAKLYVLDDKIGFVGSSNFTSNGLKISGYGNLELSAYLTINEKELDLINNIQADSLLVTKSVLEKLEGFALSASASEIDDVIDWWEEVLSIPKYNKEDGLFVSDLPWCHWDKENKEENIDHDNDMFSFGLSGYEKKRSSFINSKIYHYVLYQLNESDSGTLYFGELTQLIHSTLRDDLLPYRSEIKNYVANIYSYIENLCHDSINVDRLNYSQRLSLISNE
ncbi:phospholipase D-like domain-containing protein [Aliivibrio fischeri]|uniref:phospholipase D-like domain-containing protein n=1 Tax=Aliivibrio fischeri TaxID=668 RepID=UPI001F38DCF3|nr:phospholipase D-like domain-containing protein [Aliivibrio fischeri]MCE7555407.1 phospholipase D-like domain-containing protein [Aliivibrio fischeri]MCE7562675.1 phospholipase D-like domain-containing protein [Aliivibrio fischeri]MCE7570083.1 phospholipase D-like domain-containing protein [Aliivibrio fischeri]